MKSIAHTASWAMSSSRPHHHTCRGGPLERQRCRPEQVRYVGRDQPRSRTFVSRGRVLISQISVSPNAEGKDGARPLHRAVRTRCAGAVRALLANGADVRTGNRAGSTALHLAVQNISDQQNIIASGRQGVAQSEAFRRRGAEIEQEVRAGMAMQLAEAGAVRSWVLRRRIRKELDRLAPPEALY